MAEHERPGKILTKTEKMKRMQSAKTKMWNSVLRLRTMMT